MLSFSQFILEAKVDPETGKRVYGPRPDRRSKSSISPSRERFLERKPKSREDEFKSRLPEMSVEEKHEGVHSTFKPDTLLKVRHSSHDPKAPIDMTRPLPDSVRALGRAIIHHFGQGVMKKTEGLNTQYYPDKEEGYKRFEEGHNMIRVAKHAMRTYIGQHYAELLPHNESREILKKLFSK
jgi:hypothetical protein